MAPSRVVFACAWSLALAVAPAAAAQTAPVAPPATAEPAPAAGAEVRRAGGPVTVTATPNKTEVSVGEVFTLELKASGPPGTIYDFAPEASGESFELRTPAPPDGGKAVALPADVHRYDAVVYALQKVQIPEIPVRYHLPDGSTGEAASAPVTLGVASLLPKDPQQQKLAEIRGPQPVSIGLAFWIAVAAAALLAAAVVVWLVRRRRRKAGPAAPVVAEAAPDVEARRELDALAASSLLAAGEYRGFYIRLTVIAKRYLERRLSAPILEMTTAETLAFLRGHPVGGELLTTVREVAEAADRIKFARGEGLAAEAERHLGAVRDLVATVEARLAPPAPAKERAA